MEDWETWQKNILEIVEAVSNEVEEFFVGVTETIDEIAEQMQATMGAEIDRCLQELWEPLAELYAEFDEIDSETDQFVPYTYIEDPTIEKNPACIGCHHYHGQVYGGNLLVCAMHPYGWDDKNCPDWESN